MIILLKCIRIYTDFVVVRVNEENTLKPIKRNGKQKDYSFLSRL